MSSDVVLSVRNISKCFEVYEKPVHRLYQTLCAGYKRFYKEFWALRNISFDVRRGECIGIVGKNGAGKSTLLQIITGTLTPTAGEVAVNGRVAALLELGSGFNPEFTGRENVYLNASILGLSHEETSSRFQSILNFADIGDFIDQPVKTYSSGMMVRLAFAVQILTDPDVLIVDEALAVGDAAFQRKCFARMDALRAKGVTIILVTHDTETVKQRCDRAIFLKDGHVAFDGPAENGVVAYMRYLFPAEFSENGAALAGGGTTSQSSAGTPARDLRQGFVFVREDLNKDRNVWGVGGGLIRAIRIYGLEEPCILRTPSRIRVEIDAVWDVEFVRRKIGDESLFPGMMVGIRLADTKNIPVYGTNNMLEKKVIDPAPGACTVCYELDLPMLRKGEYFLTAAISIGSMINHVHLVWDDLAIQLHGESDTESDGVFYCPTRLEVL